MKNTKTHKHYEITIDTNSYEKTRDTNYYETARGIF